ncbi:predicted protein [Chaetoceros tenuissimus]|uniref:Uncharacterized protein n=1 Tax=Chaetoceros tenuissimus TaxID=426638 RepID=A0AAD3D9I2_9STRA|nr:predicted protein [Chaetoceros tenuissimus]
MDTYRTPPPIETSSSQSLAPTMYEQTNSPPLVKRCRKPEHMFSLQETDGRMSLVNEQCTNDASDTSHLDGTIGTSLESIKIPCMDSEARLTRQGENHNHTTPPNMESYAKLGGRQEFLVDPLDTADSQQGIQGSTHVSMKHCQVHKTPVDQEIPLDTSPSFFVPRENQAPPVDLLFLKASDSLLNSFDALEDKAMFSQVSRSVRAAKKNEEVIRDDPVFESEYDVSCPELEAISSQSTLASSISTFGSRPSSVTSNMSRVLPRSRSGFYHPDFHMNWNHCDEQESEDINPDQASLEALGLDRHFFLDAPENSADGDLLHYALGPRISSYHNSYEGTNCHGSPLPKYERPYDHTYPDAWGMGDDVTYDTAREEETVSSLDNSCGYRDKCHFQFKPIHESEACDDLDFLKRDILEVRDRNKFAEEAITLEQQGMQTYPDLEFLVNVPKHNHCRKKPRLSTPKYCPGYSDSMMIENSAVHLNIEDVTPRPSPRRKVPVSSLQEKVSLRKISMDVHVQDQSEMITSRTWHDLYKDEAALATPVTKNGVKNVVTVERNKNVPDNASSNRIIKPKPQKLTGYEMNFEQVPFTREDGPNWSSPQCRNTRAISLDGGAFMLKQPEDTFGGQNSELSYACNNNDIEDNNY